jgi:SAM-dependent methyltransferase
MDRRAALQRSYDRVTPEYAARFFDELAHKPLDRALLDCFAEQVPRSGPVADVGCGPGQIGRYLLGRGLRVVGVDLSPAMVALAAQLTPEIPFRQGNMLALDVPDGAWAGSSPSTRSSTCRPPSCRVGWASSTACCSQTACCC